MSYVSCDFLPDRNRPAWRGLPPRGAWAGSRWQVARAGGEGASPVPCGRPAGLLACPLACWLACWLAWLAWVGAWASVGRFAGFWGDLWRVYGKKKARWWLAGFWVGGWAGILPIFNLHHASGIICANSRFNIESIPLFGFLAADNC